MATAPQRPLPACVFAAGALFAAAGAFAFFSFAASLAFFASALALMMRSCLTAPALLSAPLSAATGFFFSLFV